MVKLIHYVAAAILTWSAPANHPDETADVYSARVYEIAEDIAAVVQSEPSPFSDDDEKTKSATLLASLAFWESNFQAFVDRGVCNNADAMRAWVKTHYTGWVGACDGTIAVSMWQIHPELGFVFTDDGGWRWRQSGDAPEEVWSRQTILHSRRAAARVALHLARQSLAHGARLCQYTGEGADGNGCPKGDVRLSFAKRWTETHPIEKDPPPDIQ